jgi:dipeptidase D
MPGWPANPKSVLLDKSCELFKNKFKKEAKIVKIHAGLECGIIMNKFPKNNMEAISIGPDLRSPHSTDEKLHIESSNELYQFIVELLKEL